MKKPKRGPPFKPAEEKFIFWGLKWPPELLVALRRAAPDHMADFVRIAVAQKLRRNP
jgi:hypothetical protein